MKRRARVVHLLVYGLPVKRLCHYPTAGTPRPVRIRGSLRSQSGNPYIAVLIGNTPFFNGQV
jgi:hypothetical protein